MSIRAISLPSLPKHGMQVVVRLVQTYVYCYCVGECVVERIELYSRMDYCHGNIVTTIMLKWNGNNLLFLLKFVWKLGELKLQKASSVDQR